METEDDRESPSKNEKTEQERQSLLERIASYDLTTIKHKVAWVLNNYPETRDSDITLMLQYWKTFQSDLYSGGSINPDSLYTLTPLTSLKRARAKIQNEYRLFVASPAVQRRRGTLADDVAEAALADRPSFPMYVVYMDDSGKTGEYLIVGGFWLLAEFQPFESSLYRLRIYPKIGVH